MALWQAASAVGLNAYFISSPLEVTVKLWTWIASGELWPHVTATITNMMIGFVFKKTQAVST